MSIKLTAHSKGGGCGCKISPAILSEILASHNVGAKNKVKNLLVGNDSRDDAAVYQLDDTTRLFSFKNDNDSKRFLDILEDRMVKQKKTDCLIVRDISTIQRKYLYEQLVELGYPKSYLFRHSTTHPTNK